MIQERACGGFTIPDRFERRELVLLYFTLIVAQDKVIDRQLRADIVELEHKIFGDDVAFIEELDKLLKT